MPSSPLPASTSHSSYRNTKSLRFKKQLMMASTADAHHQEYTSWSCLPCNLRPREIENGPTPQNIRNTTLEARNEIKQTEALLASELSKLSVQERSKAFDDIHCVGEMLQETPEMVKKSLAEFEDEVQKACNPVYELAVSQNRAYAEDPSFRLKFLRANMHSVNKSVNQMMSYLRQKAKYFGEDKVAREITLADLSEDDVQVLLCGLYHIQEERDQNGRVIVHMFNTPLAGLKSKAENVCRATNFMFFNMVLQDPSAQLKGIVFVYHDDAKPGEKPVMPGLEFQLETSGASMTIPVRYSALHFCLQADQGKLSLSNIIIRNVMHVFSQSMKVRSRIHICSNLELQYQLGGHGIPMDTFPVDVDGNVRADMLNGWFYKYQLERGNSQLLLSSQDGAKMGSNFGVRQGVAKSRRKGEGPRAALALYEPFAMAQSDKPSDKDVLLGRGWFAQSWPGNVKFREFIEKHSDSYDQLSRTDKQKKATELTLELHEMGIRFFEQAETGDWIEKGFGDARQKVSQMFRTLRKKK